MKEFKIFADSTADLPNAIVEELGITVIPTEVIIKGQGYLDYPDEREMDKRDFYKQMRVGEMPTTAVIPPSRFYDYFKEELDKGNDVLYVALSSGLTSTFQNANIAVAELEEEYPDGRIVVVDSLSVSLGEGLMVYYASQMKREGKSIDEIREWIEANRLKFCHWLTVDDLQHLRRGGRITAASAAVGGVLNIKPIINVSAEGKLEPVEKVRGRRGALETLVGKVKADAVNPSGQTLFIVHADSDEDCEWLKDEIQKQVAPKELITCVMGPVIGAHTGPGAIGLVFIGDKR